MAGFAAVVLFLAQTIGAAHFHAPPSQQKYIGTAVVSVDNLCALCLIRFHNAGALIVAPRVAAPTLSELAISVLQESELHRCDSSHLFGRAPPAHA
jgi:hypothetical protein